MPVDEVTICNMALARIGVSAPIVSVDGTLAGRTDTTSGGDFCVLFYEPSRDELFQDMPWGFATRWALLAFVASGTGTAWEDQWLYSFAFPSDCIVVRRILTTGPNTQAAHQPFAIGGNATDRLIFTDWNENSDPTADPVARIEYTAQVALAPMFDRLWASALAWKLAAELRQPMQVAPEQRVNDERMYQMVKSRAAAASANEQEPGGGSGNPYVDCRS